MLLQNVLPHGLLVAAALLMACAPGARAPTAAPAQAGQTSGAPSDPLAPLPPLPQKITLSYVSVTANYAPVYVAMESGLFAKHGLDADLTLIASGPTSIQSLVGGDVQFVIGAAPAPVAAYANGAPLQMLLGWLPKLDLLFMVDPSITSPEQLRGKAIGVTRLGGLPHVAARMALKHWGMNPDTDVQYLQMGGTPEILGGMQQGVVAGGAYAHPTNLRAQQLGFRVLGDFAEMGIPYQSGVVVGMQPYVEANPEVVRRVARAITESIKVTFTDDEATLAAVSKYTRVDDPAVLHDSLGRLRTVVQKVPYPSIPGLHTVIEEVADSDPRAAGLRPEDLINTAALEQLEREGFVKAVWGE
jgi:NitT/TauT family transport system substrate-binding protein